MPEAGSLTEWLGNGLQNRLRRFESARNLLGNLVNDSLLSKEAVFFDFCDTAFRL